MYYVAKIAQAAGLGILLYAFVVNFPDLMSYNALGLGALLFIFGWVIQKFLLRR
jgi:hypothetical protein